MARAISAAALREMLAQNSGEVFLILLTLESAGYSTIRVVNNTENIVSRGNTFTAFPFSITLPNDVADKMVSVELQFSNVSRILIDQIRAVDVPMTATVEVVGASTKDTVEVGPMRFQVSNVNYDKDFVKATLEYEPILNAPFPEGTFSSQAFPGLFGLVA